MQMKVKEKQMVSFDSESLKISRKQKISESDFLRKTNFFGKLEMLSDQIK